MATEEAALSKKQRMAIFINMLIACIAGSIIWTGTSTALPPLAVDFGIDVSIGQWVTSGYSLAQAIGTLLTAYLVTRFPARPLYIGALGLIVISLAGAALAPTFEVLMLMRITQAFGSALVSSMAMITILTIFPAGEKGTAMGWYGTSQGAAAVFGPVVGGMLIDLFGWRSLFWAVAIIYASCLVLATFCMRSVLPIKISHFDIVSFILSAITFGGATYGIGALAGSSSDKTITYVILVVSLICGILFVRRQLASQEPFLDIRLFTEHRFTYAVILSMLMYIIMVSISTLTPIYIETTLGNSATVAGLVTAPGAILMALCSPIAGRIYDQHGIRQLAIVGGAITIIGTVTMAIPGFASTALMVGIISTFRAVGVAAIQMTIVTWGLERLDAHDMAHAQALLSALRNIAGSVGAVVFTNIMAAVGTSDPIGMIVAFTGVSVVSATFLILSFFWAKDSKSAR